MRRGAHAAADGSFGRSAAAHAGRGAVLLFVAFLLGLVLLQSSDHSTPIGTSTANTTAPKSETTQPPAATTTTTAPQPAHDPKTVKVLAANATTTNGVGDKVRRKLIAGGFDALQPVTSNTKLDSSQIFFVPGYQPDANAIATALGVPLSNVLPMPAKPAVVVGPANVLVMAGRDVASALTATTTVTTAPRAPTATTAKPSTSSTTAKSSTSSTTSSSSSSSSTTSTTKKS